MSLSANPFESDAFGAIQLTAAINRLPNNYGVLGAMKLFPPKPVTMQNIAVEMRDGLLAMLPTVPRGAPATVGVHGKRKMRSFIIPHIPHEDVIKAEEIQGLRAFGQENQMETYANVLAMRLNDMRNKHAITLEWLRMGALKGVILDADGSTIYDLYNEFNITQKVVDFAFSNAATDVKKVCLDLKRYIEDNLKGEISKGVQAMVSAEFFDALTGHKKVQEAWALWQDGQALRADQRDGFDFAGITFVEYRGQASDKDGTVRKFIESGQGHAFPTGTNQCFSTYFAPADFMETVNTLGQELYAKQEPAKYNRGTDLHTQSNPLPMCHRPELLVKLTMS
ncbi:MAG: major capsid protein [Magnetococcales bacterium]|nr:major capsid protein [Magnetococcales bacterium]